MTKPLSSSLIGKDACEAILRVLKQNSTIRRIALFEPPLLPFAQHRKTLSEDDNKVVAQALAFRNKSGIPFWDSIMLTCIGSQIVPTGLLDAALLHNRPSEGILELETQRLTVTFLRSLCDKQRDGRMLAISSRVETTEGLIRHIPMIDFRCPAADENLPLICAVVERLGVSGTVLVSGKSYHFYGDNLVTESELIGFLAKALLFTPIVDRSWIAHQLMEGSCALRISSRAEYAGPPRVVAHITSSQAGQHGTAT